MKQTSGETGPTPKTVCDRFDTSPGQRGQGATSFASTDSAVIRP